MEWSNTSHICTGHQMDFSNQSEDYVRKLIRNDFDRWIYTLAMPMVVIIGTLLNFSFIYVVWKIREMRNHLNLILINLSAADVAFLVSSGAWKIIGSSTSPLDINFDQSVLGELGCRLVILLNDFFSFTALFFVTFIAVERYYAVCKPFRHIYMIRQKRTVVCCSIVWISSMFFAVLLLPAHWQFKVQCIKWPSTEDGPNAVYRDFPTEVGSCASISPSFDKASFALLTVPFFIALVLNLFIYFRILGELQKRVVDDSQRSDEVRGNDCEGSHKQQRARNAAARMLITNGLVFFFCNSPFNVLATYFFVASTFDLPLPSSDGVNVVITLCRILFYINSAINPLIYGATNHRYRRSFYVTFTCRRPLTPESLSVSETRHRIITLHDACRKTPTGV